MAPKYSVVIPTLNRSEKLRRALDSVLRQPIDGELEVVVIDNLSEDDTQQVLAEPQYSNVRVIRQPARVPRIHNFMTALKAATGEYLAILYDDEEMLADNLLSKGRVLDEHPEVVAVTSSVAKRDFDGTMTPGVLVRPGFTIEHRGEYLRNTFLKAPGGLPQVLMRRWVMDHLKIEQRDEPLDDNAFVLRLSSLGAIATMPEALVTETFTDAEMVNTGLLEPFEIPNQPGETAYLPAVWFGWCHYRIRVEHLLSSTDLSKKQTRALHRAAFRVFRRDVWKGAYWRWHVSKQPGAVIKFLAKAGAFDLRLLIPPVLFFLQWKTGDTTAPMATDTVNNSVEVGQNPQKPSIPYEEGLA
ncbi:MAG: glycosyltransferase family 2 protein [Leptolyngbya sp. SIOISBB]|nr:glycosyltransferase family 2 protein [Leptolyngbya sp. SIOISBB]